MTKVLPFHPRRRPAPCAYEDCPNEGWVHTHDDRTLCGVHGRTEEAWHAKAALLLSLQLKKRKRT